MFNEPILEFIGEHKWLSNFFPCTITVDGQVYASVEHAYMSFKSDDQEWKDLCIDPMSTAGYVKRKSKTIKLVDNWDDIKLSVMEKCLNAKFRLPAFANKLLETGDIHIQEGNRWNDKFWGVCLKTNEGSNNLGILLMKIRERIKQQYAT